MTAGADAAACLDAENGYAAKWLDNNNSLYKKIATELSEHHLAQPADNAGGNDTVLAAGPWKISVKKGHEVHAFSNISNKITDNILYTEPDSAFKVHLRLSQSGIFIFITSSSDQCSEVRVLPVSLKSMIPVLMQERRPGVCYSAEHFGGDNIWILSNDNAPMRSLLIAPARNPVSKNWKAAVKENDSVYIGDFTLIDLQYLVIVQRRNLATSVEITSIYDEKDKEARVGNVINFPEPEGLVSDLSYDKEGDKLVFRYSSSITPLTCYTYGIHSMHLGIRWKKQVRHYVQDDYKAQVAWARGINKTRFPVSVLGKREMERPDGSNPLLLFIETGNPSCNGSNFSPELLSLIDRGFYLARVHLPSSGLKETEGSEIVSAAISALTGNRISSNGLITLAGKGNGALIALNINREHPGWIRTLVLDCPVYGDNPSAMAVPDTYIVTEPADRDKLQASLKLGSSLRKLMKPENTLLLKSKTGPEPDFKTRPDPDFNSGPDPDFNSGLITFILLSNGISN